MKRIFLRLAVVLVIVYVAFLSAVAWAMHQPPEAFGRFMKHVPGPAYLIVPFETFWNRARVGALHTGDAAPDFALTNADHSATVRLADFRGKQPVVLVFGSYT
jgi:hypothetical protein